MESLRKTIQLRESSPKYWPEPTNQTEVTSSYLCERPLLMGEGSNEVSYVMIYERYRKFKLQYRENLSSWLPFVPVLPRDALVVRWKRILQQGMYGNGARNVYSHLVLTGKACRAPHLRNRFQEGRREHLKWCVTLLLSLIFLNPLVLWNHLGPLAAILSVDDKAKGEVRQDARHRRHMTGHGHAERILQCQQRSAFQGRS